ncbi:ER degradation-enhancing alpha-mannosidase-like protein 2 [Orussus abietinus]|uniref:ER degradation-enhancing alpha-mannosidase-like protein 2 n=1 Tax=Orussus abietinus TaxID=222816 RepID=UPI00062656F2|nr:ER degradation-enhancing alpha-mannosidase-like protein 2 [Orussus abietinus]
MLIQRVLIFLTIHSISEGVRKYDKMDLESLREDVRAMFNHAYTSYLTYAYPYDELRSLSCDGFDTWGSFSLTLVDALDTLIIMGNLTEFRRVVNIIGTRTDFEANINVSVFETNIRVIGGLLSAHLLSHKAGIDLEPGWPCNGPLLRLAEDMAKRLLVAFDTPTGMPYGTVNLKYGIPDGETSITCTAGIGTFLVEFGTLSRLTGDPLYEEVAMNAIKALNYHKSNIGLVGNHIDVLTGHWTAQDSGIGAGIDSYFEYLAKGALLLQDPLLMTLFQQHKEAIEKYTRQEDWHVLVSMNKGHVTLPIFQSLDAYWPGLLSLFGEIDNAMKTLHNYHKVWKQYGFMPEIYNIPQSEAGANREGYPLRPELIESVMYLYRATNDSYLLQIGVDILRSLQHSAKSTCGYATISDIRDHRKGDRMESFFLAETTKYLFLLFDPDNFIHNSGCQGDIVQTQWGECVVNAGGYIFNTEAHPIDPGALHCCRRMDNLFMSKTSKLQKTAMFQNKTKNDSLGNISLKIIDNSKDQKVDDKRLRSNVSQAENNAAESVHKRTSTEIFTSTFRNESIESNNAEIPELNTSLTTNPKDQNEPIPKLTYIIYKADDGEAGDILNSSTNVVAQSSFSNLQNQSQPLNNAVQPRKIKFEPQTLLEKIRRENMYSAYDTTMSNDRSLCCSAQSFLRRLSILGEFF